MRYIPSPEKEYRGHVGGKHVTAPRRLVTATIRARTAMEVDMIPSFRIWLPGKSASSSLIVGTAMLLASAALYAQSSSNYGTRQVTRAEVRQELKKLESVGYRPVPNDLYYPDDVQEAGQRLQAKHKAEENGIARVVRPER